MRSGDQTRQPEPDAAGLVLAAWSQGLFPMADGRHGEVAFYQADPRSIIRLEEGGLTVSRSLRSLVRSRRFDVRCDTAFGRVIRACADAPRDGSWINDWIIDAYDRLHVAGHAHSVEAWLEGELVGGLYGLHIGGAFFGESMFTMRDKRLASGASKVCLVHLWNHLRGRGFTLFDTQYANDHMRQFGVVDVPLRRFRGMLKAAVERPTAWGEFAAA